jgi:hypothetical protein
MRYAYRFIPAAIIAVAGAAAGVACSTSNNDGSTQSVQQGLKPPGDPHNPPGNNGTVKIEEFGSTDEIPENDPHVGCKFEIEFRGYDQGDLTATWSLVSQPPSGTDIPVANGSVFIGADPAGGANDLDGTVIVDLTKIDLTALGLTEQPNQGFHLKLTVHAPGSIGSDTKHKTFWVGDCFVPPPPQDAGPPPPEDAGPPPPEDAGPPPPQDAGPPPPQDAGPPPPQDAGPPPPEDAGPPPPTDAGRTW